MAKNSKKMPYAPPASPFIDVPKEEPKEKQPEEPKPFNPPTSPQTIVDEVKQV